MELVEGVVTLEEPWDQMTSENPISRHYPSNILCNFVTPKSKRFCVGLLVKRAKKDGHGGPLTGFLNDGPSLLSSIEPGGL